MMLPEARRDGLLLEEVGDELVVYDERSHRAHRLNWTASTVWRLADGNRSVEALAAILRERVGQADRTHRPGPGIETVDQALGVPESEALVLVALDDLARADLLRLQDPIAGDLTSRRRLLATAAGVLVPVIASIVAPTPADAQSNPTRPTTPAPPTRASFNGTYMGTGTLRPQASPGTCQDPNFPPTVNLRGVLALDVGATNPWIKTHLPGTVFAFASAEATVQSNSSLQLTASGTFQPDNFFSYAAVESYTITGGNLAGTQTFSLSVCTWIYDVMMTRQ